MQVSLPAFCRALGPAFLLWLAFPGQSAAECRTVSSFTVPNILDVYAKRHSDDTTTLWFVHKLEHEVVCGSTFCEGSPDEYVWRDDSGSNANISSLSAVDSCGESWILTPSDPGTPATAVMRIKFGENYHLYSPPVHYDRRKNFTVKVDPDEVYVCECLFQLNCDSSGLCGDTATLLASPPTCSIC